MFKEIIWYIHIWTHFSERLENFRTISTAYQNCYFRKLRYEENLWKWEAAKWEVNEKEQTVDLFFVKSGSMYSITDLPLTSVIMKIIIFCNLK